MNANANFDSTADMGREPNSAASSVSTTLSANIRPFYWSLRREVWENRSIYIAPIAVAVLVLVSALINMMRIPQGAVPFHQLAEVSPEYLRLAGVSLYGVVSAILGITAGIVGWFYCLDALYSERRERSVLFWKSLPISDTTTVLSKVAIGMVVVPLVSLVVGLVLYVLLLLCATVVLMMNGASGALLLANTGIEETLIVHVYAATVAILWSAPLYAWAIFVSSWVRRATFLWALLPPAAVALAEGLAFGTQHFATMMGKRLSGGLEYAFVADASEIEQGMDDGNLFSNPERLPDSLFSLLDPAQFFSQPGLWIGLVVAAILVAASIWMRRYREPL